MQVRFGCLYTSQVTKKKKSWSDGTCLYNETNKKLVLKDGSNITLNSDFIRGPPKDGDEIEFKGHIIQITDNGYKESASKPPPPHSNLTTARQNMRAPGIGGPNQVPIAQRLYQQPSTAANILSNIHNQQSQGGLRPQIKSLKGRGSQPQIVPLVHPAPAGQRQVGQPLKKPQVAADGRWQQTATNFIEAPFNPLSGGEDMKPIQQSYLGDSSYGMQGSLSLYQPARGRSDNRVAQTTFFNPVEEADQHDDEMFQQEGDGFSSLVGDPSERMTYMELLQSLKGGSARIGHNTNNSTNEFETKQLAQTATKVPQHQDPSNSMNDLSIEPYMIHNTAKEVPGDILDEVPTPEQQRTQQLMRPRQSDRFSLIKSPTPTGPAQSIRSLMYSNTLPCAPSRPLVDKDGGVNVLQLLQPFDPTTNMILQLLSTRPSHGTQPNAAAAIIQKQRELKHSLAGLSSTSKAMSSFLNKLEGEDIQLEGSTRKGIDEHDKPLPWASYVSLLIFRCSSELLHSLYSGLKVMGEENRAESEGGMPTAKKGPWPIKAGGAAQLKRKTKTSKRLEDKLGTFYPDSECRIHTNSRLVVRSHFADREEDTNTSYLSLTTKKEIRLYLENTYKDGYSYGDVWIVSQCGFEESGGTYGTSQNVVFAGVGLYHSPTPWGSGPNEAPTSIYARAALKGGKGKGSKKPTLCEDCRFMIALRPITPTTNFPRKTAAPLKVQAVHLRESSFIAAALRQLATQRSSVGAFGIPTAGYDPHSWTVKHILSSDRPLAKGQANVGANASMYYDPMFDNIAVQPVSGANADQPGRQDPKTTGLYERLPKAITDMVKMRVLGEFMLNENQADAVAAMSEMISHKTREELELGSRCMLLGGVYGCGKSRTLLCVVLLLWMCGLSVLVLSGTNVAVDRILVDLVAHMAEHNERNTNDEAEDKTILKAAIEASRKGQNCDPSVLNKLGDILNALIRLGSLEGSCKEARKYYMKNEDFRTREVATSKAKERPIPKIVFSTCASYLSTFAVYGDDPGETPQARFDALIVDECCQIPEYLATTCVALCSPLVLVLSGDERQLPPVTPVGSNKRSLFGRLMAEHSTLPVDRLRVVNLGIQYRCNVQVAKLTNELFYSGGCWDPAPLCPRGIMSGTCVSNYASRCKGIQPGISVIRVKGRVEQSERDWQGATNQTEADAVCSIVSHLLSEGDSRRGGYLPLEAADIGIISPYRAQCSLIRRSLSDFAHKAPPGKVREATSITVATVDAFQGQERNVIIVSVCREYNKETSFTGDPRRVNVAMSRAKEHLMIVRSGSPSSLNTPWDMADWFGSVYDGLSSFTRGISLPQSAIPAPSVDYRATLQTKAKTPLAQLDCVGSIALVTSEPNTKQLEKEEQVFNNNNNNNNNEIDEDELLRDEQNDSDDFSEDEMEALLALIGCGEEGKQGPPHHTDIEESSSVLEANYHADEVRSVLDLYNIRPKRQEAAPGTQGNGVEGMGDTVEAMDKHTAGWAAETLVDNMADVMDSQSNIFIPYDDFQPKEQQGTGQSTQPQFSPSAQLGNATPLSLGMGESDNVVGIVGAETIRRGGVDSLNSDDFERMSLDLLNMDMHDIEQGDEDDEEEEEEEEESEIFELCDVKENFGATRYPRGNIIRGGGDGSHSEDMFSMQELRMYNRGLDAINKIRSQSLSEDISSTSDDGEGTEDSVVEEEPSGETLSEHSSDEGGEDAYYHSSQDPDYTESGNTQQRATQDAASTNTNNIISSSSSSSSATSDDLDMDIQNAFPNRPQKLPTQLDIFSSQCNIKPSKTLVPRRALLCDKLKLDDTKTNTEDSATDSDEGSRPAVNKYDLSRFRSEESQTASQIHIRKETETDLVESDPESNTKFVNTSSWSNLLDRENEEAASTHTLSKEIEDDLIREAAFMASRANDSQTASQRGSKHKRRSESMSAHGTQEDSDQDEEESTPPVDLSVPGVRRTKVVDIKLFEPRMRPAETDSQEMSRTERFQQLGLSATLNRGNTTYPSMNTNGRLDNRRTRHACLSQSQSEGGAANTHTSGTKPIEWENMVVDGENAGSLSSRSTQGTQGTQQDIPADQSPTPSRVVFHKKCTEFIFDPFAVVTVDRSPITLRVVETKQSQTSNNCNNTNNTNNFNKRPLRDRLIGIVEPWQHICFIKCSFRCGEEL